VVGCWSNALTSSFVQGKSASETLQMLTEACGVDAVKKLSGIKDLKRVRKM
jgi:hypothetical protein